MRRTVFGTGFALGAIGASQQSTLIERSEVLFHKLDDLVVRLNEAGAQGIATADALAVRDELRAAAQRLVDRVGELETEADVGAWNAELARLTQAATDLDRSIRATSASYLSSRTTTIGLWTGAVVLAGIGLVLGIRWYGKRRRR